MGFLAGVIIGVFLTICVAFIAAGLWYIETNVPWDHQPTDEEVGQRIMEDFILPREDT